MTGTEPVAGGDRHVTKSSSTTPSRDRGMANPVPMNAFGIALSASHSHPNSQPNSQPYSNSRPQPDSHSNSYPPNTNSISGHSTPTPSASGAANTLTPAAFEATSSPHSSRPVQRTVKRPRPVKSCFECRKRKLRCDRVLPCSQCQKSGRKCRYAVEPDGANHSDASDSESAEITAGPLSKKQCLSVGTPVSSSAAMMGDSSSLAAGNPMSRINGRHPSGVTLGITLDDIALRMDRLEKLLVAREKSPERTERTESRTHLVTAEANTIRELTVKMGAVRTRLFGQSSTRVLLNLFPEARDLISNRSKIEGIRDVLSTLEMLQKLLQEEHRRLVAPISVFVDSILPLAKRMTDILPGKAACDKLLASYIDTNEIIYRLIHVPSFRRKYDMYWQGEMNEEWFLPQLLAVISIGTRFVTESKGLGYERVDGVHIPTACALVRAWLAGLRGKQLVELTTLQTELLLLHAHRLMSLLRIHDAWTQLGYIVRMAMTMGLHRDPDEFAEMTVFYGELRRRLWFTILDMDLHISLACNLPCLVREGDYTCRPPRNLNDADIQEDMVELPPGLPIEEYTECQIQVYASMTLPTRMRVAHLVNRIDTIRDYHEVLEVGARLGRFLEDVNYVFPRHGLADGEKSKQWRWRVVMDMHVRRPLLALYRPFALGVPDAPPEILRAYLRSSMVILRYLDELDPALPHYREMGDMYVQILKYDIVQAAFSILFYVKDGLLGREGAGADYGYGPRQPQLQQKPLRQPQQMHAHQASQGSFPASTSSPSDSTISTNNHNHNHRQSQTPNYNLPPNSDDIGLFQVDRILLATPSRLVATVRRSMDLLLRNARGDDLKNLVPLTVVLSSVQVPGSGAMRVSDVAAGLAALLDACLRNTGTSLEKVHAFSRGGVGPGQLDSGLGMGVMGVRVGQEALRGPPYLGHGGGGVFSGTAADDYMLWDLDSWSSLVPTDQQF